MSGGRAAAGRLAGDDEATMGYEVDEEHLYHLAVHYLTPIKSRTARSTAKQLSRLNETTISFPRFSNKRFSKNALVALRLPQLFVLKYLKSFVELYLHLVHVEPHVERDLYDDHLKWFCSVAWEYKLRIPRLRHQGFQECTIEHTRHVAFEFERNDRDPYKYELVNIAYDTDSTSDAVKSDSSWSGSIAATLFAVFIQLAYSFSLLFSLNSRIQPSLPTPAYRNGELETSSICTESVYAPESRSESLILELKQGFSAVKSFVRFFGLAFMEFQREVKSLTWVIKQSIVLFYQCSFALMVGSSYADVPIVRETRPLEEDDDWQDFDWQSPFLARPEHRSMYTPPSIVKTPSSSPTIEKKRVSFSFPSAASASVALRPPLERNRHMYETLLRLDRESALKKTAEEDSDENSSDDGFRRAKSARRATTLRPAASASTASRITTSAVKTSPLQRSFELQSPPERYGKRARESPVLLESQLGLEGMSGPALESPATDTSDAPSILFAASPDRDRQGRRLGSPPSIESSIASDDLTPETSPEVSISQLPDLPQATADETKASRADKGKGKAKNQSVRRRKKAASKATTQ